MPTRKENRKALAYNINCVDQPRVTVYAQKGLAYLTSAFTKTEPNLFYILIYFMGLLHV